MIKNLSWLRQKLELGSKEDESTILVLDKTDCKQLLKDIESVSVGIKQEREIY